MRWLRIEGTDYARSCSPFSNVIPSLRCLPRRSANNPRQSRKAWEPDSSRTIQPPNNVGPSERQFILMMWRSDLSDHPYAGGESTDRTTQTVCVVRSQGTPITSPSIHRFE